jgi:hypothetical protein
MRSRAFVVFLSVAVPAASLACSDPDASAASSSSTPPPADAGGAARDARASSPNDAASADARAARTDAARPADASAFDAAAEAGAPSGWVPSVMAVGYGGLRVISRDEGASWRDDQELASEGVDDRELLRGVAYGAGIWVATGWRFFTSKNGGLAWDEHDPPEGCSIMEGVAHGAGHFVGTCGVDAYTSNDGAAWMRVGPIGETGGHTYVFFEGGRFYSSGDSDKSYASVDGAVWTELAGVSKVAFCAGEIRTRAECPSFWHDGVYLSSEWRSKITRSTDGVNFAIVHDNANLTPGNNAPYTGYAFALGYSPP